MIYFREANQPHLSTSESNDAKFWHVECYNDDENCMFPVGVAYVIAMGNRAAQLQFILVADQWRRQGFGKQLLQAIKDRWPFLTWTSAMGPQGAALLESAGLRDEEHEE